MEQEESAYITSLHLKGYKSIRDVSVTLNKGLNILIGANGSGTRPLNSSRYLGFGALSRPLMVSPALMLWALNQPAFISNAKRAGPADWCAVSESGCIS